ncbi:MAG: cbb3-type cytochrome oxidase assembly protein CcoS [Nannocystaceae bacterium]|jgi:cbb3-type cytochrome oxidase maturation protein|nr:cbb3-type cytochrome oxidase assembly protein CcoS [Nannocystaceae bacterium]
MSVLYALIPFAAVIVAAALLAFRWAIRSGQFDDLDTPPLRVLFDERAEGESKP